MTIGIPYAHREFTDDGQMIAICPECSERINLVAMKDAESFTGEEYAEHYAVEHGEFTASDDEDEREIVATLTRDIQHTARVVAASADPRNRIEEGEDVGIASGAGARSVVRPHAYEAMGLRNSQREVCRRCLGSEVHPAHRREKES